MCVRAPLPALCPIRISQTQLAGGPSGPATPPGACASLPQPKYSYSSLQSLYFNESCSPSPNTNQLSYRYKIEIIHGCYVVFYLKLPRLCLKIKLWREQMIAIKTELIPMILLMALATVKTHDNWMTGKV